MKRFVYFLLLSSYFLLLHAQNNYEFGPSIIVNDDTPGAYFHTTTQRSIGCRGDTVYLVWRDDRYGNPLWYNSRVFFSKSTDAGNTWSPNLMISQNSDTLWGYKPHLALDVLGNIYVAYNLINDNTSNRDICFTKSTDGGITFSEPIIVNDSVEVLHQRNCAVAVDSAGQNVYVVWQDWRNPQYEPDIYFARSTDGGSSFLPSIRVNDDFDTTNQWFPVVACDNSGQNVYVAWMDGRDTLHGWDVYFSRSTDYGQTFGPNYPVNDTGISGNSFQGRPSVYWKNSIVYLIWDDWRDSAVGTYFDKSINGGVNFGIDVCVVDTFGVSAYPSITVNDSNQIFVVWEDGREYSTYGSDIYFSFSDDSGQTFNPNVCVNDHEGVVSAWDWNPSVCVNDSGKVFATWSSTRNDPSLTNFDIYFAAGNYVGIQEYCDPKPTIAFKCYPNPFSKLINISFGIGQSAKGKDHSMKIYDISGRLIRNIPINLCNQNKSVKSVCWNGTDQADHQMPAGIYFVELVNNNKKYVKKIVKVIK